MEKPGTVVLPKGENGGVRRICFLCTGNTCRSPMAQAVANDLAARKGLDLEAFSAGLYACSGAPIAQNAIRALEEAEIRPVPGKDYHTHLAHTLSDTEAEEYDLLICMTPHHALELTMRYPALVSRILCMPTPISDPFGGDLQRYRGCLEEITRGLRALLCLEDPQ